MMKRKNDYLKPEEKMLVSEKLKLSLFLIFCVVIIFIVGFIVSLGSAKANYQLFYKQMVIETIKETLPCNRR